MTQIGDIVHLHDKDTKASPNKEMRWCMVVAIAGSTVRVAPRSVSRKGKVFTSQALMPEFTKDAWFNRWALPVPKHIVDAARNIGQLPEPERSQLLALFARRSKP